MDSGRGLSLAPMRGLRPHVADARLGHLLCPPYDVIDSTRRAELLAGDPDNAVTIVLPEPTPDGYAAAADTLRRRVDSGLYRVDEPPMLYVYEMTDTRGRATRGLLGALELRDPADGVVLPHENTMAGPVADRLAVMTATDADLEPIYLVYDGGGPASSLVADVDDGVGRILADTIVDDGVRHRLWSVTDRGRLDAVATDLGDRQALIADGHHRYATYLERQRRRRAEDGAGPWDRGLTLLVDSSEYGPQVHAIHRVVPGLAWDRAVAQLQAAGAEIEPAADAATALAAALAADGFAAAIADGTRAGTVRDPDAQLRRITQRGGSGALAALDASVVHRAVIEQAWQRTDDETDVGYAHSIEEALAAAHAGHGVAILMRPTPVGAVAAVAAAGDRMPRKSTLFTPKPASGLVMRRLADQW